MTAIEKLKETTNEFLAQQINAINKNLVLFVGSNTFNLQLIEMYMRSHKIRNCITRPLNVIKNFIDITAKINLVVLDLDCECTDINMLLDTLKEKKIGTIIYSEPHSCALVAKRHNDIPIIKKGNETTLKELYTEILKHQ